MDAALTIRDRHRLVVSEMFGPTVQGEGPTAGRRSSFLRLGLCNLDCSWCDTPYTWDWTGKNGPRQDRSALLRLDVADVADRLRAIGARNVVITGGEPMLQQRNLAVLFAVDEFDYEIETNGTISSAIDSPRVVFNVSPKLASSGVDPVRAEQAIDNYADVATAVFKFVVGGPDDLEQIDRLVGSVDPSRVWLMPEGRSAAVLIERGTAIAEHAIARGYNFTQRLHVLLWGDERER